MSECDVDDDRLEAWAAGGELVLDDHVANCDQCQARLADWWDDGGRLRVVEPTMLAVRLDSSVRAVGEIAVNLVGDFMTAIGRYGFGLKGDD